MKEIKLIVIFEGTIFTIEEPNTHLHRVLYEDCEGIRIHSADDLAKNPGATHLKMGFNGCAVDYGIPGLLFGTGLDEQAAKTEEVVKRLIRDGYKVKLNAIGLSRGGIAALMLVKKLAHIDRIHLKTNLLLLDPVPGNALLTAKLDMFNQTLTNQVMDVSDSMNLRYVEALYPYLEVGDDSGEVLDAVLAHLHIPIRPAYPTNCEVKEEVILGAHLSAFQDLSVEHPKRAVHGVEITPIIRQLSKEIISNFLFKTGSLSEKGEYNNAPVIFPRFDKDQETWSMWLRNIIVNIMPKDRSLHSPDNSKLSARNTGVYLNKTHSELAGNNSPTPEELSLKIIPERSPRQKPREHLSQAILVRLTGIVIEGMTLTSKEGTKGQLLHKINRDLSNSHGLSKKELSFILRDIFAVALQRDRNSYSLFSTTTSGYVIVNALNTPEFNAIRVVIRPDGKPVTYDDLSNYVTGRSDLSIFNSQNKEQNLEDLNQSPFGTDRFSRLMA
jgi:hypothetical protein